jgi:hypothetical protein
VVGLRFAERRTLIQLGAFGFVVAVAAPDKNENSRFSLPGRL